VLKPIRQGDRGPAVEDVQRRLLALSYDLGPTGVDGVFLGATLAAVRSFQAQQNLAEDGIVGPTTWAALVDATFTLGDRLLYVRFPYFHGNDVRMLQSALNVLGFACGEPDGIFGAYTERAVREFQANIGQPADGIAGPETVRAVMQLRHVWVDKDPRAPVALAVAPARAAEVLANAHAALRAVDEVGREVSGRVVNLAVAMRSDAALAILDPGEILRPDTQVVLHLGISTLDADAPRIPVVAAASDPSALSTRLVAALAQQHGCREAVVDLDGLATDERTMQRVAVALLDGLCVALS